MARAESTTSTPAPHRLVLSAAEYAYLVATLGLSMPPGWQPQTDDGNPAEPADLVKRGVLRGDADLTAVHPSVQVNLRILAAPQVMLDTTATISPAGSHSLHAIAGPLGASLFALGDGAVELSLFAATDLGRELIRAVPADVDINTDTEIDTALRTGDTRDGPPHGRVPLAALHELGVAKLLQPADPDAPAEVLSALDLPAAEAQLAGRVAAGADGALVCLITARLAGDTGDTGDTRDTRVRSARVTWLHTDRGWLGVRPDPDASGRRMVLLEPVTRADLGVWVAPYIAGALEAGSHG